ncbi:MAG: CaiB/BaiF CoA transferase family protein [Streptosporangiaceae bacterium]
MTGVLSGLRVLDFCWVGAGALVTQALALHGAEVIKIESRARPDNLRVAPPFRPGTAGLDASGYFASRNANKKSFALNMRHPAASAVARSLAESCSVVTSNFRPGVMERWGLDYDNLRTAQPGLIYLTMPMQGTTGPNSGYAGFGSTIAALAGLTQPSGLPGRVPVGTGTHYPDHVPNPGHALVALLAALVHRNRTGRGGRIELSQFESTVCMVGPALVRYSVTGEQPRRQGNHVPEAAPHGVYPCQGTDNWIAISVRTDAEWHSLAAVLAGGLAADDRFATADGRKRHEAELDSLVGGHTARWERWALMRKLQHAGLAAGVVETAADVFDDPVLAVRRYWRTLQHPVMGPVRCASAPHIWNGEPVAPATPAPLLGQHTEEISKDLLGMTAEEYDGLVTDGVLW